VCHVDGVGSARNLLQVIRPMRLSPHSFLRSLRRVALPATHAHPPAMFSVTKAEGLAEAAEAASARRDRADPSPMDRRSSSWAAADRNCYAAGGAVRLRTISASMRLA
jgi:hypothetical protein